MMADDTYKTITGVVDSCYTEKRSRFIAYAVPVRTVEEVKEQVDKFRKQYYDARHVCWAYMLGPDRSTFRANDDGEPSGTAGKPIPGHIHPLAGLIVAYRAAAAEALSLAEIEERTVDEEITVQFEYPFMNGIMRIIKEDNPEVLSQSFDMNCEMTLRIRKSEAVKLRNRLLKVETAYLKE